MTIPLKSVLLRLGNEEREGILGHNAIEIIQGLRNQDLSPFEIIQLILTRYSGAEILRLATLRNEIILALNKNEIVELANQIGFILQQGVSPWESLIDGFKKSHIPGLLAFFETPDDAPMELDNTPSSETVKPNYALFPHQLAAAHSAIEILRSETRRVLLHMPTGSGKTRTAMHIVAEYLAAHPGHLVVWLASTEELCAQAADEFEKAWQSLGAFDANLYRFWGEHIVEYDDLTTGLLVAGLKKANDSLNVGDGRFIGRVGARTSLVVFDEAHQSIAETYRGVVDILFGAGAPDGTRVLGLSATPGRSATDVEADRELVRFWGNKKVVLQIPGFDNPIDGLIQQGFLARPIFENLPTKYSESETPSGDYSPGFLKRIGEDSARNVLILAKASQLVHSHDRIILFAPSVESAELIATVLNAQGIEAHSVSSRSSPSMRRKAIERYKGPINSPVVLCNYGVFTTGFDAPRTSAAIIARPTTSLVLYSQMIGRATRGPKAGGNREALILTVVDRNLDGFSSMQRQFSHWDEEWRTLNEQ